ncbi:MAG: YeeE/YedE family protein [Alphaproteobacteria bacterium]|nr:YeeE/YedE family protein [Alphaproteobacteria bacterium]
MEELSTSSIVGLSAFVAGLVFGAVVQRTHFCTMGALADLVLFGDGRRMRAWLLAIAVAMLGSQALASAGIVDLGNSFYRASDVLWLGALIGGLMFGFGMTQTGGCTSRNVVRLGAGNLKSLVVLLVVAITAYMTMNGLFAIPRLRLEMIGGITSTDQGIAPILGLDGSSALLPALAIAVLLVLFCFKDKKFRTSGKDVTAGLVLGVLIPLGWLVTGVLGADDFEPEPLASFTFVAPIARGLIYLMTYPSASLSFGIAAIGGVLLGALLAARWAQDFRIEGFSGLDDLVRHLIGAALMGVGGVLGVGCTIGQGMTGLSTLAIGSVLTTLSIMAGGVFGVRYLERGSLKAALRALLPLSRPEKAGPERSGG